MLEVQMKQASFSHIKVLSREGNVGRVKSVVAGSQVGWNLDRYATSVGATTGFLPTKRAVGKSLDGCWMIKVVPSARQNDIAGK